MPQMWPSQWSLLFFMFLVFFVLFLVVFYFNFTPEPDSAKKSASSANIYLPWQW